MLDWLEKRHVELLTALRIVAGFIFWEHGAQKLFGFPTGNPMAFLTLVWFAGVIEFFGGLAITLGLFTRAVAFLAAGEMAVAYWTQHSPRGFWPVENMGERAALFCFIWLYISAAGGGKLQLGNLLGKKSD
ncbi:MAG: DoxX family protein [Acidobacteria bacterium]|nr:DoxX family protein [Acidobacteriota bacterium]